MINGCERKRSEIGGGMDIAAVTRDYALDKNDFLA
jgi:hypothetical protein